MNNGIFITVEGPEGAGKTTILTMLHQKLEQDGHQVVVTREPGGIAISEQIRQVLLNKENTMMDERTEALLYAAARRQHLVEKVIPALKEGAVVLCDRFVDSSLAYQGYARGLGIDEVLRINEFAIEDTMPHMTLYFDIEPAQGLKRIHANSQREINRLDLESLSFHEKVRKGYLVLADRFSERIKVIDASGEKEEVFSKAKVLIEQYIETMVK